MVNLTRASEELFQRSPDERFASLEELQQHCQREREFSTDRWQLPQSLAPQAGDGRVAITLEDGGEHLLNEWSFSQLCRLAGVSKETVNRLSPETASRALRETLPSADKPMQLLTAGRSVRSLHGVSYTRLWNSELLSVVGEFAHRFPATAGWIRWSHGALLRRAGSVCVPDRPHRLGGDQR